MQGKEVSTSGRLSINPKKSNKRQLQDFLNFFPDLCYSSSISWEFIFFLWPKGIWNTSYIPCLVNWMVLDRFRIGRMLGCGSWTHQDSFFDKIIWLPLPTKFSSSKFSNSRYFKTLFCQLSWGQSYVVVFPLVQNKWSFDLSFHLQIRGHFTLVNVN